MCYIAHSKSTLHIFLVYINLMNKSIQTMQDIVSDTVRLIIFSRLGYKEYNNLLNFLIIIFFTKKLHK